MFISLGEIAITCLVALVVLRPNELLGVVAKVKKMYHHASVIVNKYIHNAKILIKNNIKKY